MHDDGKHALARLIFDCIVLFRSLEVIDLEVSPEHDVTSIHTASRIVDAAWEELQRSPFVQRQLGINSDRLPDVSQVEAQRRSAVGQSLLARLDALDLRTLPRDLTLTLRLVRFRAQTWAREADWYWTIVDPLGTGMFGLFLPTAYCGGILLSIVNEQFRSFRFAVPTDADRYLSLVAGYGLLIDQFAERTAGQAERGVRIPKIQAQQARSLLERFKSSVRGVLAVTPERTAGLQRVDLTREIESRIATCVEPAFDRALAGLSDTYLAEAPETVGLSQYPGGAKIYAELVKLHTTLDLTPEEVHMRGHARMSEIESQMRAIRSEVGFAGDDAAFVAELNADPRWRADSVAGVESFFQRYTERLKPHFKNYFSMEPKATYGVAPLPEALQGSMTYGYYDAPREGRAEGLYMFNAGNLTKRALFTLGTLTYHELVPGHHLHIASQQENESLHPFRKYSFVNAYNEGWAEYAATFVGEIGMYAEPAERYGRLVMDALLTSRLVVDTGMNALGWPLERARDYMREHSHMEAADILTESVRYSCDIPAQALAYKLGDTQILALREKMHHALGASFQLKDFHSAILGPGALPMTELEWHVDREIERHLEHRSP